jgi:hypothetical protein
VHEADLRTRDLQHSKRCFSYTDDRIFPEAELYQKVERQVFAMVVSIAGLVVYSCIEVSSPLTMEARKITLKLGNQM